MAQLTEGKSQASQRRFVRFTDQHGRKLGVNIELATGAPTGHWTFPKGVPIQPPAHSLKISQDLDDPFKVFIDYDRIIREGREAMEEYDRAREKLLFDKPDMKEIAIEHEIGKKPHPVEPWIAAKQGDLWTLGLTDRVNVRVAAFLDLDRRKPIPEYDFTAEDNYLDIEEDADKDGIGGKRVPVGKKKKSTESQEAA